MLLGYGYLHQLGMFYFLFFQKAESNRLQKKQPANQNFGILFFCFCLK